MRMIIMYGIANSGKSTSLRAFYERQVAGNSGFETLDYVSTNIDYNAIVVYRGYRIGIITHGDTLDWIKSGLQYAKGCDIVICACRTKGAGCEYLAKLDVPQIWIEKGRVWNKGGALSQAATLDLQQKSAMDAADRIFECLQLFCTGQTEA